jgi:hypothetical protein
VTDRKDFEERLQRGYGYHETKKKRVRSGKRVGGFRVESAEIEVRPLRQLKGDCWNWT